MARNLSPEDREKKQAIFDSMSPRRRKHIVEKVGFENWDPFIEPKDPIDMRKDKTKRTSIELAKEFLASREGQEYSNAYGQGVWEMCLGIVNEDDRFRGMFEFAGWYRELLKKHGLT